MERPPLPHPARVLLGLAALATLAGWLCPSSSAAGGSPDLFAAVTCEVGEPLRPAPRWGPEEDFDGYLGDGVVVACPGGPAGRLQIAAGPEERGLDCTYFTYPGGAGAGPCYQVPGDSPVGGRLMLAATLVARARRDGPLTLIATARPEVRKVELHTSYGERSMRAYDAPASLTVARGAPPRRYFVGSVTVEEACAETVTAVGVGADGEAVQGTTRFGRDTTLLAGARGAGGRTARLRVLCRSIGVQVSAALAGVADALATAGRTASRGTAHGPAHGGGGSRSWWCSVKKPR